MSRKRSRFEAIPSGHDYDREHGWERMLRRFRRVLQTSSRYNAPIPDEQQNVLTHASGLMNLFRTFGIHNEYDRSVFGLHTGRVHFIQRQWRRAITRRRIAVVETLKLPFELVERIWRQVVSAVSVPLRSRVGYFNPSLRGGIVAGDLFGDSWMSNDE